MQKLTRTTSAAFSCSSQCAVIEVVPEQASAGFDWGAQYLSAYLAAISTAE